LHSRCGERRLSNFLMVTSSNFPRKRKEEIALEKVTSCDSLYAKHAHIKFNRRVKIDSNEHKFVENYCWCQRTFQTLWWRICSVQFAGLLNRQNDGLGAFVVVWLILWRIDGSVGRLSTKVGVSLIKEYSFLLSVQRTNLHSLYCTTILNFLHPTTNPGN